jgi:hypothetical protein
MRYPAAVVVKERLDGARIEVFLVRVTKLLRVHHVVEANDVGVLQLLQERDLTDRGGWDALKHDPWPVRHSDARSFGGRIARFSTRPLPMQ